MIFHEGRQLILELSPPAAFQILFKEMRSLDCPEGAEEILTAVSVISDCETEFNVPDAVLRHFRMQQKFDTDGIQTFQEPPSCAGFHYRAKVLFQRIDGTDVCIVCMYVQEYDGADADDESGIVQKKRVYLAYIDSVEHLRLRRLRPQVYHAMLSAYFATARKRGISTMLYIWSCPPSRGNSFVFWGHPQSQRTPTKEHLLGWYHDVLCHAVNHGIITDVKSLYEDSFEKFGKASKVKASNNESTLPCPQFELIVQVLGRSKKITQDMRPVDCEGDFAPSQAFGSIQNCRCPSIQLSILLENCIMSHPNASLSSVLSMQLLSNWKIIMSSSRSQWIWVLFLLRFSSGNMLSFTKLFQTLSWWRHILTR